MIKSTVVLFVLVLVISGCHKYVQGSEGEPIFIVYTDSSANPIFSPGVDGIDGFFQDSVLVYGINDGVKALTTCFEAPGDTVAYNSPTGRLSCRFDGVLGYIRFIPCPGTPDATLYSTTIIHLKRGVDDTLRLHFTKLSSEGNLDSIWYNGQLKYFQPSIDAIGITK